MKILFYLVVLSVLPATLFAQTSEQDSLALVDLYHSTDGDNWINNTNWLTTSPVSTWYGITVSGGRVVYIDLCNNNLVGDIPTSMGNLANLEDLRLSNNQLSGSIPAELGNLSNLEYLFLFYNQLSGSIPAELGNLSNLIRLNLNYNQLSGSIPAELGNLSNLISFDLGINQLSGSIPAELGNLSNLTVLSLSDNQLSGSIPAELGNLSNLGYLYLNRNQLSGSIPAELGNLANLEDLHLYNNQLSGSIPAELGNLSNLTRLLLDSNQLSGSIPAALGNLSNLTVLWLDSNQLSGSIPAALGNLSNLRWLYLYSNQLSGSIPAELGNLSNLEYLRLFNNQLSGSIPAELGNLSNLIRLLLYSNQLSGSIPVELGNLSNLQRLDLHSNQLSGSIPAELGNLSNLTQLWLHSNQFIDLPNLSSITTLNDMRIQNNQFTFEDIEPNIGVAPYFIYSPQDSVGTEQDTTVIQGTSLTLSVSVGGEHNQYQWKKDGVIIPEATDSAYTISSVALSDSGAYICEITNTIATELTLYSRPINVTTKTSVQYDISGHISYYSNDDPIDSALVKASLVYSDTTDLNGDYDLLDLPADDYIVRPEKEHDTGAAISAYDAAWILQYGVGLRTFTPYQMIAGDVSGNGGVSAFDAAKILQYGVGLINQFPVMPDSLHFWRFVPDDFSLTMSNWMSAPDSIAYTPLNSDTADNYKGIIYGDVSGNWHPTEKSLAKSPVAIADIRLENVHAESGDKISLPLYLDNGTDIIAMSFILEYNPQVLKALGASLTSLTQDYQVAHKVEQDRIKIALAGSRPIAGSGAIVNLEFEVLESELPENGSLLKITEMLINEGNIAANIQLAEFKIEAPIPDEYELHQNYPNPFNPETMIKYQLPKSGRVVLKIYNAIGQEIRTLINEEKEAGYHEIRWDGRDDRGVLVSSGVYIYRLQAGNFVSSKKMIFMR